MKKWFDRRFDFRIPVWQFPSLFERLAGTPARAEELVHSIPPPILTRREAEGWSIQENLGHLLDLEPLWLGRVDDILSRRARLREADLTNRKTHDAKHNSHPVAQILRNFRAARSRLVQRVEELDQQALELSGIHPRLEQPMRILDLIDFVVEHDDHHLARMRKLRRRFE